MSIGQGLTSTAARLSVQALLVCMSTVSIASAFDRDRPSVAVPIPDGERGKRLFATKGCVVCHAVNGVGGTIAPALDSDEIETVIRPLEFVARMLTGMEAMLALQALEFGYQIELSATELADLAAFASDANLQAEFSETDIPDVMRGWSVEAIPETAWPD